MRPLSWSFSARIAAPPDAVFAWMRDFREDDHSRPAFLRGAGLKEGAHARREVLESSDERARIRDSWGTRAFVLVASIDAPARAVRVRTEHGYETTWRAQEDGEGTLLVAEGRLAPRGLAALFVPLFAGRFRSQLEQDFRGHVADARDVLERPR